VGQTFKLKNSSGKIQFGTGKDPATDPFTVKVRYKVDGDSITYSGAFFKPLRWAFTGGTIRRVAVDVSGEPYLDMERHAQAMLARE
jgi:hypothetical protein